MSYEQFVMDVFYSPEVLLPEDLKGEKNFSSQ